MKRILCACLVFLLGILSVSSGVTIQVNVNQEECLFRQFLWPKQQLLNVFGSPTQADSIQRYVEDRD
jgi:hypothetical protein